MALLRLFRVAEHQTSWMEKDRIHVEILEIFLLSKIIGNRLSFLPH